MSTRLRRTPLASETLSPVSPGRGNKFDHSFLNTAEPSPRQGCSWTIFAAFFLFVGTYAGILLSENYFYFLRPVPSVDSPFSAQSVDQAREILVGLSKGPRVAGTTANEVIAKEYLLRILVSSLLVCMHSDLTVMRRRVTLRNQLQIV